MARSECGAAAASRPLQLIASVITCRRGSMRLGPFWRVLRLRRLTAVSTFSVVQMARSVSKSSGAIQRTWDIGRRSPTSRFGSSQPRLRPLLPPVPPCPGSQPFSTARPDLLTTPRGPERAGHRSAPALGVSRGTTRGKPPFAAAAQHQRGDQARRQNGDRQRGPGQVAERRSVLGHGTRRDERAPGSSAVPRRPARRPQP